MDLNRQQLEELAFHNPVLALLIVKEAPQFKPTSYEVKATFLESGVGTPLELGFAQRVFNDVWVQRVEYTVQRPLYAAGSPLRGFFEEYNKKNPGIDVYMKLDQTDTYDVTQTAQPIENIFAPSGVTEPKGFMGWRGLVIQRIGTPFMKLTLTRTLQQDEIPYIVRIAFHVLELRGCRYGEVSKLEALAQLRGMGFCVGAPDPT